MLDRVLILASAALAVAALWGIIRLWQAWRIARLAAAPPLAGLVPPGRPAVVAFSSPTCAECRTRQAPALAQLAAEQGAAVTIRSLSAPEHPALIDRLGILTVPATVVLDAAGQVRQINLGFADSRRLAAQLSACA